MSTPAAESHNKKKTQHKSVIMLGYIEMGNHKMAYVSVAPLHAISVQLQK